MKNSAIIRFLSKEEGGRLAPPMTGYKPQIKIENVLTSCIITPKDPSLTTMEFGIEHEVFIELQYKELYSQSVDKGMVVCLYEGTRLIGHGSITD